jgi:hypothetical protein
MKTAKIAVYDVPEENASLPQTERLKKSRRAFEEAHHSCRLSV